jgi:hypothetical protein
MRVLESHGPPGSRREAALRASPLGGVPRSGRGGQSTSTSRSRRGVAGASVASSKRKGAVRESRGSSNTPALTPPAGNCGGPKLLQASVDALKLAYRLALDEVTIGLFEAMVGDSSEPSTYTIDGEPFELRRPVAGQPRFLLVNATKTVIVGQHVTGFPVHVEFRALYLRTQPLAQLIEEGERIARYFAASEVAECRVWRVDLCADATGFVFCRDDERNCVTRARRQIRFQAPEKVYTGRRRSDSIVTGFVIAPGNPLSVRIYDKTEELFAVHGRGGEKTRTELAAYRAAGWDGQAAVWRVEAQFRATSLRELGAGTPAELLTKLDSLWHYVVGHPGEASGAWLRLVVRDANRVERCSTDPRWRAYQEAQFLGREPAERVEGSNGGVSIEQMVGDVLSCLGSRRSLRAAPKEDSGRKLLREDFARAAELALLLPYVRQRYAARREAARSRSWSGRPGTKKP